jgi:hypothetical protein
MIKYALTVLDFEAGYTYVYGIMLKENAQTEDVESWIVDNTPHKLSSIEFMFAKEKFNIIYYKDVELVTEQLED